MKQVKPIAITLIISAIVFTLCVNFNTLILSSAAPAPPPIPQSTSQQIETFKRLNKQITLDVKDLTFESLIKQLQEKYNFKFHLMWDELKKVQIPPEMKVELHLPETSAMRALSLGFHHDFYFDVDQDGIVHLGSYDAVNQALLETRLYPIHDFIKEHEAKLARSSTPLHALFISEEPISLEEYKAHLVKLFTDIVDPQHWVDNGGDHGTCEIINDVLIVNTTPRNHLEIVTMLKTMRKISFPEYAMPTRNKP